MHLLLVTTASTFAVSIALAQITHIWLADRIPVLGSFLGLQKSYNSGIAFSMDLGPYQDLIIIAALIIVAVVAVRTAQTRMEQIGFGCILGGGLANVVDRALDGVVTDMIQVGSFPIFNVADVCINIGVGLLIVQMIMVGRTERRSTSGA